MSMTFFYGGAGLILLGVVGLIVLLVLYIKNRRKKAILERDGIFEEIEQAESRIDDAPKYDVFNDYEGDDTYDEYAQDGDYDNYDPYEQYAEPDNDYQPQAGPVMPMEVSMYTGEFDINDDSYSDNDYDGGYEDDYNEDYDDGDEGYDDEPTPTYQPAEEPRAETPPTSGRRFREADEAPPAPIEPEPQAKQISFDTEEILREALGDKGDE